MNKKYGVTKRKPYETQAHERQGWKAQLLLLPIGAPGFQDTGRAEVM